MDQQAIYLIYHTNFSVYLCSLHCKHCCVCQLVFIKETLWWWWWCWWYNGHDHIVTFVQINRNLDSNLTLVSFSYIDRHSLTTYVIVMRCYWASVEQYHSCFRGRQFHWEVTEVASRLGYCLNTVLVYFTLDFSTAKPVRELAYMWHRQSNPQLLGSFYFWVRYRHDTNIQKDIQMLNTASYTVLSRNPPNSVSRPVASLRLVSPRAATDGVTFIFL